MYTIPYRFNYQSQFYLFTINRTLAVWFFLVVVAHFVHLSAFWHVILTSDFWLTVRTFVRLFHAIRYYYIQAVAQHVTSKFSTPDTGRHTILARVSERKYATFSSFSTTWAKVDQFSFFTVKFRKDMWRKTELKLTPLLKSVAALPCECKWSSIELYNLLNTTWDIF